MKKLNFIFIFGIFLSFTIFLSFQFFLFKDIYKNKNNFPKVSHIIVLGAGLKDNKPNELLEFRLIKTLEYYKKYPNTIFILSGGVGKNEKLSEAKAMENYLIEKGIPKKNLILEENSTSTYENLKFSKEILKNLKVKNIGVISSSFHLYRTKYIAKKLNMSIETIYANTPYTVILLYAFREFFAYCNELRK